MDKELKEQIKIISKIVLEPNEFKRYMLLQLWISQLVTQTIQSPVQDIEDKYNKLEQESDNTNGQTSEQITETVLIYDLFRDIKSKLTVKNQQLQQVLNKLNHQKNILKCMNGVLELGENSDRALNKFIKNCNKVEQLIKANNDYIERINNLSESKIESILNDATR